MKVKLKSKWDCEAELVDIITPGKAIDGFTANSYFEGKAPAQATKGSFKESQLVFKTADKFVVIPDTVGNRWLWSKL